MIRCLITLRKESSIISIDSNITYNINRSHITLLLHALLPTTCSPAVACQLLMRYYWSDLGDEHTEHWPNFQLTMALLWKEVLFCKCFNCLWYYHNRADWCNGTWFLAGVSLTLLNFVYECLNSSQVHDFSREVIAPLIHSYPTATPS